MITVEECEECSGLKDTVFTSGGASSMSGNKNLLSVPWRVKSGALKDSSLIPSIAQSPSDAATKEAMLLIEEIAVTPVEVTQKKPR